MGLLEPDKWNYLQMLLLAQGPLRSFFEVKVGRTVEQIIEDLRGDGSNLRRIADEKDDGDAVPEGASPLTRKQREELRRQMHEQIDILCERAPNPVVSSVSRILFERAGKYGGSKK